MCSFHEVRAFQRQWAVFQCAIEDFCHHKRKLHGKFCSQLKIIPEYLWFFLAISLTLVLISFLFLFRSRIWSTKPKYVRRLILTSKVFGICAATSKQSPSQSLRAAQFGSRLEFYLQSTPWLVSWQCNRPRHAALWERLNHHIFVFFPWALKLSMRPRAR